MLAAIRFDKARLYNNYLDGPPPHGGYGGPPPHGPQHHGPPSPGVPGTVDPSIQPWDPNLNPLPPDFRDIGPPPIEDPNCPDPVYPQPSIDQIQRFEGYEKIGGIGQSQVIPPPQLTRPPTSGETSPVEIDQIANLNADQCRDAILEYSCQHVCYGKTAARRMELNKVLPMSAFHYTLETFCESRSTSYVYTPYQGGVVDGPEFGTPPLPWQITCSADQLFHNQSKKFEVPHTATIKLCHACDARGWNRCHRCHGRGQVRCHTCQGRGHVRRYEPGQGHCEVYCTSCGAEGNKRCSRCGSDGRLVCSVCLGFKRLKFFIELTVTYVNYYDDHILEKTDMPDQLVLHVGGTIIMEQTRPFVNPITNYPVSEICNSSVRLVNEHRSKYSSQKQICQRQQLRAVPVTEVIYKWKDKTYRFWVYGSERKVYAPDYPQKYCWGCSIL